MVEPDGAAHVVERSQHAGEVAKREVRPPALGHRPQRLAFEVEQDPAAGGMLQHLAQVVVAVDALHRRPFGFESSRIDGLDRLLPFGDRGHLGDRDREPATPGLRYAVPVLAKGRPCGEELGEQRVHLGGGGAEGPRGSTEVLAGCR